MIINKDFKVIPNDNPNEKPKEVFKFKVTLARDVYIIAYNADEAEDMAYMEYGDEHNYILSDKTERV